MAEIETRDYLGEHSPDELFGDVLFGAQAALNDLLEVATFAVLHDDVEL